jgi:hypothetical protein
MMIELLYFDGCPHYRPLELRLRSLLADAGIADQLVLRRVSSEEEAHRDRFLGSPTVRIDGRDIEPGAESRTDVGLKCRLYKTRRGLEGEPETARLAEALRGSV